MPTDLTKHALIQAVVPRELADELRARAEAADRSVSAEVRRILRQSLERDGKPARPRQG